MKLKATFTLLILGILVSFATMSCNSNPVSVSQGTKSVLGYTQDSSFSEGSALDILWVIDNSGSMAEEQSFLGQEFNYFINKLANSPIDFHIAVTTTDASAHKFKVGELRSKATPFPGNAVFSALKKDATSAEILAKAAKNCLIDPNSYTPPTKEQIQNTANQPGSTMQGDIIPLFPKETDFREFPTVLKRNDYLNGDGTVDVDRLKADFSCLSLVGTNGSGVEKGISALLSAVSPERAEDTNKGFIRKNAKFAVVFVTDENDCTMRGIDGFVPNEYTCSARICEFFNAEGISDEFSPLLSLSQAKNELLTNLAQTKGVESFKASNVIAAALTGKERRPVAGEKVEVEGQEKEVFPGPADNDAAKEVWKLLVERGSKMSPLSTSECVDFGMPYLINSGQNVDPEKDGSTSCSSLRFGTATSGDRYNRFVRQFENHYPSDKDELSAICSGSFDGALQKIADLFSQAESGCITKNLYECGDGVEVGQPCGPAGSDGVCLAVPNRQGSTFCSAAIRILAIAKESTASTLAESGYCKDEVGTHQGVRYSCIISPDKYDHAACPADVPGVLLDFKNKSEAASKLEGIDVQVVYTAYTPVGEEETTSNETTP